MTVKELIEKLSKVENKTKEIVIEVDGECTKNFIVTENNYWITFTD